MDTHGFIKELMQAGFSERQAEIYIYTTQSVVDTTVGRLKEEFATKQELKQLEHNLSLELEKVHAEIHKSKNSMLLWNFAMFATQMGLIFGLLDYMLNP